MAEHEGGTRVPLETQVREQFSAEWKKADTADKKKSLLQRLLEMIKDASVNARTAVNEAEKANSGAIPPNAKDAKESAAKPILELFQFLTGNNGQPIDAEALKTLNLNETQLSFLQTLGKTRHSPDTATFIAQVVDRTINTPQYLSTSNPGESKTQLESDYEKLKLNPVAAESFKDSIKKLAQEGKLKDTKGNVLTEADVEQKFQSSNRAESQQQSRTSETQNQQSTSEQTYSQENDGYKGRRREKSIDKEILGQYSQYMNLLKGVNSPQRDALDAQMKMSRKEMSDMENDPTISAEVRERETHRIQNEQNQLSDQLDKFESREDAALAYLYTDEVHSPFNNLDEVKQYLKEKFGDNVDIENVSRIFKASTSGRIDGAYEGYQDLADKINYDYTAERLKARIIKDGKINLEAVKKLQGEIEDDIGVLFETLYNSPKGSFEESFSSYSEGQMLRKVTQHLRVEINQIINEVTDDKKRSQFKQILTEMLLSPIQRRPSLERIVHQYQQVGATIDLEKLKDILKTYNITTLQEFYNDDLTAMINNLMPAFIQKLYVENGNNIIPNFFQLVQEEKDYDSGIVVNTNPNEKSKKFVLKYREQCIDYLEKVINNVYKNTGRDVISRDRIDARFSRAYLDNFLLTLRGVKVMANAKPNFEKFSDVPFVPLITGLYNPSLGWGKLGQRGRGNQESGDAETTEYSGMSNFVFNEVWFEDYKKIHGDVFHNYHPAENKKEGDKRVLFDVYPDNKHLMQDLRTGKWDIFNTMNDVYKGMVFGDIIDQHGWTFDGFNETTINNLSKRFYGGREYLKLDRKEKLELRYRTSGIVTAFWEVDGFAAEDATNMFVRHLYDKEIQNAIEVQKRERGGHLADDERKKIVENIVKKKEYEFSGMDWSKTVGEYTKGDKRFDKIFDVKLGGKDQKVAFREYRMHRVNAIKGEVFHQLLLKNPNAWLGEMVQMFPELNEGSVSYTDNNGGEKTVNAADFYFDLQKYPDSSISKDLKVVRDRFRFKVLTKFRGKEEGDYLSNVPHLKKIMNFYSKLYDKVGSQIKTTDKYKNATEAEQQKMLRHHSIDTLDVALSTAYQRAVEDDESAITPNYITDETVRDLMFDEEGLIPYFNTMVHANGKENYFGDGKSNLGEENGFYQRWSYSKEQSGTRYLPAGDINMKYLLEDVKSTQALDRRLNTDMAFVKAQEVLNNVPSVCKKAADSDTFGAWWGAIEELHKEMTVIADEDQAMEQKYQQLLYQTVLNWFALDSDTEKLWTGWLHSMKLGTDAAMATLKSKNMSKFVLDQDGRRQYLINLQDKSYLKGNYDAIGGWGFDTAEMIAGVGLEEIIRKQAIYAITGAIAITILTAIKEAYEEEVEEE